jgi:hypothetical protein
LLSKENRGGDGDGNINLKELSRDVSKRQIAENLLSRIRRVRVASNSSSSPCNVVVAQHDTLGASAGSRLRGAEGRETTPEDKNSGIKQYLAMREKIYSRKQMPKENEVKRRNGSTAAGRYTNNLMFVANRHHGKI